MNIMDKPVVQLEILISTMNRNSLDFLEVMFQNNTLSEFQILVINQTIENRIILSKEPKIRVINSFEKGLSKSRNLAIANAIGDICLLADDDVIYLKGFEKLILKAYASHENTDLITFKTLTTENKPYSTYPKKTNNLKDFIKYVLSIEITFKRLSVLNSGINFNENFGLGATFEDSENYIFLTDLKAIENFKLLYVPEFIVLHPPVSSSSEIVSDRLVFARSALNYKLYGNAAYLYVAKLIFFLLRKKLIKFGDISHKYGVAHSGIKTYKKLN